MSRNQITTVSNDDRILQTVAWDTTTKSLEIVHQINLGTAEDVSWKSVNRTGNEKNGYITTYIYELFDSAGERARALKFPLNGSYYPATGLPHTVVVELQSDEGGAISSTSGSTIPD